VKTFAFPLPVKVSTNTVEVTSFYEQKIQQALEDLDAQKFPSIRAVAKAHDIPLATLNRRSKGGISK
jgi:hypothetical protein